jgi:glycosyltransferase involved in cell wall biosynthesis
MTTVVINAISVREGGSLVVLRELLAAMARLRPDWQWHVATNREARDRLANPDNTTFHVYPEHRFAGWRVRFWYETELPRLIRQTRADLLFSQTNYLPARRLSCPALLLVQHAGHFSEIFKRLTEAQMPNLPARLNWRLKGHWVRTSIRRANRVTVQTAALAQRILQDTGISADRISVIPHGIGQAVKGSPEQAHIRRSGESRNPVKSSIWTPAFAGATTCSGLPKDVALPLPPVAGQPVRIGYITKHGVQKNFAVLFAAAARLKTQGLKPVIVLTLADHLPENQAVMAVAQQYGVAELIENHGELKASEIDALYRSLHLFVFPSLCESFGFPLVEAMAHGLPLLVAATDSNREVAGSAGLPFPPDDANALAGLIRELALDPAWHQDRAVASRERAACFSWDKAAAGTIELMENMLKDSIRRDTA